MPIEARDRLVRSVDLATVFAQRRSGILSDDPDTPSPSNLAAASRRPITTGVAVTGRGNVAVRGGGVGVVRTNLFTARRNAARAQGLQRSPRTIGRENMLRISGGRIARGSGTRSVLPAWYPRTPLRDITGVVRAIEKRRARLREANDHQTEISQLEDHREHDVPMISPNLTAEVTPRPHPVGKVSKILLNVINQAAGDSKFLTPQKILLNSIDTVQEEVLEELEKLKKTPKVKQAAKKKKVCTLMSMR